MSSCRPPCGLELRCRHDDCQFFEPNRSSGQLILTGGEGAGSEGHSINTLVGGAKVRYKVAFILMELILTKLFL